MVPYTKLFNSDLFDIKLDSRGYILDKNWHSTRRFPTLPQAKSLCLKVHKLGYRAKIQKKTFPFVYFIVKWRENKKYIAIAVSGDIWVQLSKPTSKKDAQRYAGAQCLNEIFKVVDEATFNNYSKKII
jgi:hypothetical protein